MRTLYGMKQSPWTEKARWALDHHALDYTYHEHLPMIGELLLRAKLRGRTNGAKPSVPLLVDEGDSMEMATSSLDIARYADRVGRRPSLFPPSDADAIQKWNALSDRMINVGRSRVLHDLTTRKAAQKEALPSFVPGFMRGAMAPSAVMAAKFLASKHAVAGDAATLRESELRPVLEEVRSALAGGTYLVGAAFSYADIAVAAAMRAVKPEARAEIGPETRTSWTDDELATDFEDLLMWRDALYEKHR